MDQPALPQDTQLWEVSPIQPAGSGGGIGPGCVGFECLLG
jgi:hypothetical protein